MTRPRFTLISKYQSDFAISQGFYFRETLNHALVANFNVANTHFNTIRKNKISAKISEITVNGPLTMIPYQCLLKKIEQTIIKFDFEREDYSQTGNVRVTVLNPSKYSSSIQSIKIVWLNESDGLS